MASNLGPETKEALLVAIKEQAAAVTKTYTGDPRGAEALRDLAQAYALLERPIGGTGR